MQKRNRFKVLAKPLFILNLGLALCASAGGEPLPFGGVNIAGGEFYKPREGFRPVYAKDYVYPTQSEIEYFAGKGMNVFRYQFLWETLQHEAKAPLDQPDLQRLRASVEYATSRKLVVLLDPHNYARYYGKVVGGSEVGFEDFADFWRRLSREFQANAYVWFGLVNEPHDMPTQQWVDAANAAIAAIRSTGAKNLILVPGNFWTGAQSWAGKGEQSNGRLILGIKDPLNYWAIEVHQYLDADCSGRHRSVVSATIGSERLKGFVEWCRQHRMRAVLGEFAAPIAPNAEEALQDMLQSMERDNDVWLGWAWWAAGARWGDYMFTIEPNNGEDRPQMAWLRQHLPGSVPPKFLVSVKNGAGQAEVEAGSVHPIEAAPAPEGMIFKKWAGDTLWLTDPASPQTTVTMPFKNIEVEAVFQPKRRA